MMASDSASHRLAALGLQLPPVIFGTSALGNLYRGLDHATKRDIVAACVAAHRAVGTPVVFDSAGKYGAGLALEELSRCLHELEVDPAEVVISNKLGWQRTPLAGPEPSFEPGVWIDLEHDARQAISADGIHGCYAQGCELLGAYAPQLVSVHDPDEYLAAASGPEDAAQRWDDILSAYQVLFDLRARGVVRGVGVGAKDHRVIARLIEEVDLDWVMLACSLTVQHHPPEVLQLLATLHQRGVTVINSAVFNAGFLTGGNCYNYRELNPVDPADAVLFAWRDRFNGICAEYGVVPAAACVRFGRDVAGAAAVALNTSQPTRALANLDLARAPIPTAFWESLYEQGLIELNVHSA